MQEGHGKEEWADGSVFEGDFKAGWADGFNEWAEGMTTWFDVSMKTRLTATVSLKRRGPLLHGLTDKNQASTGTSNSSMTSASLLVTSALLVVLVNLI